MNDQPEVMRSLIDILYNSTNIDFCSLLKNENLVKNILEIAERERVFYPVLQAFLKYIDLVGNPDAEQDINFHIQQILKDYQHRSNLVIKLLLMIRNELDKADVENVIFKTIDNYPNIPSQDLDIAVKKTDVERASTLLLNLEKLPYSYEIGTQSFLGETPNKRYFQYKLEDYHFEVELYPEITVIGEKYFDLEKVLKTSKEITIDQQKFKVPSNEDAFQIIMFHAIFKHGGLLRFSDIYHGIRLINQGQLNWNVIFVSGTDNGTSAALYYFINFLNEFYLKYHGENLLPKRIDKAVRSHRVNGGKLIITEIPHRISFFKLTAIYLIKFFTDISHFDLISSIRTFQMSFFKLSGRVIRVIFIAVKKDSFLKVFGWYESDKI